MKAYELLDSPEKWVKGCLAQNAEGEFISLDSPQAVRWCVAGAIVRCYGAHPIQKPPLDRLKAVVGVDTYGGLVDWNNARERTWEEVYTALKEADV